MVPRVGQRIGPYEILGRLGSGGMGLVFSAWDARLQRDVAIKILREEYATPTMRSRFLQEARAASGLNHANICTVFDIGEVGGDPFLVMELLKGETLRSRISGRGKLPAEDVQRIAGEVLDALATAHARGIIHRDIKPANIILVNRPGGGFQSKVLDFGLAKVEFGDEDATRFDLTTIGTTVGTVSYMSPEQARGEAIDARSDLFSLGSVLYEAATGELPFQGATSALIFVELLGKNPEPIRLQNPAVPKDLDRFISRLLTKSRADRFQSAAAAFEALQAVSLRKSPLAGIARWGKGAAKPRNLAEGGGTATPEVSPDTRSPGPPSQGTPDANTFLRPARRVVAGDPGAQRFPNAAGPPSPTLNRSPSSPEVGQVSPAGPPLAPGFMPTPPVPRSTPPMGSVVLRPVKPETRSLLPRDARPSGDSPLETVPQTGSAPVLPAAPPALNSPAAASDPKPSAPAHAPFSAPAPSAGAPEQVPPREGVPLLSSPVPANSPRGAWAISSLSRRYRLPGAAALILVTAALLWYFAWRREPSAGAGPTPVVLGELQNSTGDGSLSGVLATGLSFALAQSSHLTVRTSQDYLAGLRATGHAANPHVSLADARAAAQAVGGNVLVVGDLHSQGAAFELSLHLYEAATGKHLDDVVETAPSRAAIPQTIDRLAAGLRSSLGERRDGLKHDTVPLEKEATSNLEALQSFASGSALQMEGKPGDAVAAFQKAVSLDPHFSAAYLRLADLYRNEYAELAAAQAGKDALAGAAGASSRTQWLAQAAYAFHASADASRAAEPLRQLLATYPDDLQALGFLGQVQLQAGKFLDAEGTAAHALRLDRYDRKAAAVEEFALIAIGHPAAVPSIEASSEAVGLPHPDLAALALAASPESTSMFLPAPGRSISSAVAANLLDAAGHFNEAMPQWQALADLAHTNPELGSVAPYADGMAALQRALAGDCNAALPLAATAEALPSGTMAIFSAGEAQALCGDADDARHSLATLNSSYGFGSAVQSYLAPDLAATIVWKAGDAAGALRTLDAARQFDAMSLTAYLRGLVAISAGQPRLSIVQFQFVLSHRGAATLFAPEIYPLAQLGLGRAYAAVGDTANSSLAYGRFLELWSTADPNIAALAEARSHTRP